MNIDFVGVQKLDEPKHHNKIISITNKKREIVRVREKGHAPYPCTRGFIFNDRDDT